MIREPSLATPFSVFPVVHDLSDVDEWTATTENTLNMNLPLQNLLSYLLALCSKTFATLQCSLQLCFLLL